MITDCSGHGRCRDGQCVCYEGWTGPECSSIRTCADGVESPHCPGVCTEDTYGAPGDQQCTESCDILQTAAGTGDAEMASASATRDGPGQNAPFGRAQTASRVHIAPASVLKTRTAPPETNSARKAAT
jgi:hypothetical protein